MINFVLGVATPVGEIGGTAEYNLEDWFAAGAGAGKGWSGMQWAASARFRLALSQGQARAHSFDFVAALAMGPYNTPFGGDSGWWEEWAYWAQMSLDYEFLNRAGFHLATGLGVAILVGSSNAKQVCMDYCPKAAQAVFPTLHVTFGFSI